MRVNTRQTYEAWKIGKARKPASAVWTDGETIYSYGTRIVWREDGRVLFNRNGYSRTTTCQQNGLRVALSGDGMTWEEVDSTS